MSSFTLDEAENLTELPATAAAAPIQTLDAEVPVSSVGLAALEKSALKATLWTVIDYGSGQVLRLLNSLVLTWLLFPAAFGLMTLVTTLIVGITLLSDIGLAPSVIQSKRGDDPDFLNTAFTLQAMRGGVLWLIAVLLAWPAARFYHNDQLKVILPVLALSTLLTGFNSTNLLTLSRHMGVRRMFLFDFSSQIIAFLVTIAWAWKWPSVWALVAGNMAVNLYRLVLSHHRGVIPGIRMHFRWSPPRSRKLHTSASGFCWAPPSSSLPHNLTG